MRRRLTGLGCAVLLAGVLAAAEAMFNPMPVICALYSPGSPEYELFLCYLW